MGRRRLAVAPLRQELYFPAQVCNGEWLGKSGSIAVARCKYTHSRTRTIRLPMRSQKCSLVLLCLAIVLVGCRKNRVSLDGHYLNERLLKVENPTILDSFLFISALTNRNEMVLRQRQYTSYYLLPVPGMGSVAIYCYEDMGPKGMMLRGYLFNQWSKINADAPALKVVSHEDSIDFEVAGKALASLRGGVAMEGAYEPMRLPTVIPPSKDVRWPGWAIGYQMAWTSEEAIDRGMATFPRLVYKQHVEAGSTRFLSYLTQPYADQPDIVALYCYEKVEDVTWSLRCLVPVWKESCSEDSGGDIIQLTPKGDNLVISTCNDVVWEVVSSPPLHPTTRSRSTSP